jgi:hypothetical protein
MFSSRKQRFFVAIFLMGFMTFGAMAVQAHEKDTDGSDRLVKGAAAGAAVGTITQVIRGRRGAGELLKGAAVGAAAGAAVGGYSDYDQEKRAREHAEDHGRYDRRGGYDRYDRYDRYDARRDDRRYRETRPAYRWQDDYDRGRGRGKGHRHSDRCGHR